MTDSSPYHSIPEAPAACSAAAVVARFVDALGFRYRWATEGLTDAEMNFRPVESSMSMMELLVHVHHLAHWINKAFGGSKEKGDVSEDFGVLVGETIECYLEAGEILRKTDDAQLAEIENFWFMLNGPVSDSLTHVGQIVSWRRMAGNPQPAGVNQFRGIRKE
jgi:hypothetical protein